MPVIARRSHAVGHIQMFVVSYYLKDGRKVWWNQALDSESAFELGRLLAKDGKRPTVIRLHLAPKSLLSAAQLRQNHRLRNSPPTQTP